MKKYMTTDDFADLVAEHLRSTLSEDFGKDKNVHIVDLLSQAVTHFDAIFNWMANYPQEPKK